MLDGSIQCKFNAGSAIWDSKLVGKLLYLACEDGSIKVVKVKKESIVVQKTMPKAEFRCLSVEVGKDYAYGGFSDGSIRKYNLKSNNCELHFGASDQVDDFVWSLKLVEDLIFSGSSSGHLKVWDTKHGTLTKTFNQLQA